MAAKDDTPDDQTYKQLAGSVIVGGAVSMAMTMAYQTGIVRVLTEASQPLSSQDIASQLRLKERYTREVLSSLAAVKMIQVEKGTGGEDGVAPRFFLPPQHRATFEETFLFTNLTFLIGPRFTDVKACFPDGGPPFGVTYGGAELDVMGLGTEFYKHDLTAAVLKTPGLKEQLEKGGRVLEFGAGIASLSRHLAAMFPKTQFLLTDFVPQGLDLAKNAIEEQNLTNVNVQLLNIFQIPEDFHESFDWVLACNVIHDLPYPLKGLEGVRKVLKPGGHFSMVDMFMSTYLSDNIGNPIAAIMYTYSTFFCIPESYQKEDSQALGTCWGKQKARELVEKSGLRVIDLIDTIPHKPGFFALCMCQKPAGRH